MKAYSAPIRSRSAGWDRPPRVEMMPLIDVVFLLLIVFLFSVISMVRAYVLPVELPQLGSGEVRDLPSVLVVTIERDGTLSVGGEECDSRGVLAELQRVRANDVDVTVLLHGDRRSLLGDAAEVFDLLRSAGVERVMLVADEREDPGSGGPESSKD